MIRTLKILSILLTYPSKDMHENIDEMRQVLLQEGLLNKKDSAKLIALLDRMENTDLLDLQEEYVSLFDRGRAHSLHLFEHVHGESRMRGTAMVDLINMYKENGRFLESKELPDYLPVVLEFLSVSTWETAQEFLQQVLHIIAAIRKKLEGQSSDYSVLFSALEALTQHKADPKKIELTMQVTGNVIDDLNELDEEWEDPEAFGGISGGLDCGTCPSDVSIEPSSEIESLRSVK